MAGQRKFGRNSKRSKSHARYNIEARWKINRDKRIIRAELDRIPKELKVPKGTARKLRRKNIKRHISSL